MYKELTKMCCKGSLHYLKANALLASIIFFHCRGSCLHEPFFSFAIRFVKTRTWATDAQDLNIIFINKE